MTIRELRILPPFAIGRLGSAAEPQDNFTMVEEPDQPLGFRKLVGAETLVVDEDSGEITKVRTPKSLTFKTRGRIRPVAPFLEVWAVLEGKTEAQPLTIELLAAEGLKPSDLSWNVSVSNRKVERRTGSPADRVHAETGTFSDHAKRSLDGHCENFISPKSVLHLGHVRYIKPTAAHPGIRLRFTPAKGLIYGPNLDEKDIEEMRAADPSVENLFVVPEKQAVYDKTKSWFHYNIPLGVDGFEPGTHGRSMNETMPPSLYAIVPPGPSWLHNNVAISRGYLDDACDGFVDVALAPKKGAPLTASARICAAPPAVVPDSLFVRSLGDDLDQVIWGPDVSPEEPPAEVRQRAEDIVRRAYETVRFLNVAVMNGNPVNGRDPLDIDTMPAEEAFDVSRMMRPVFSERTADTLAIMRLHQQVYAALRGGAAPWFPHLLRKPGDVADFTDHGRRKMPALMCGADGSYLALTHRQIWTIFRAAGQPLDMPAIDDPGIVEADRPAGVLTARNASAERSARIANDVHFRAAGNPVTSRPVTSVGNCTPGLEVDFRAVWRRIFKGIVLREYDNLVVEVENPALKHLVGRRMLKVEYPHPRAGQKGAPATRSFLTMTQQIGPSPADTSGQSVIYATDTNPLGLAPLEWSNLLARMLHERVGQSVTCYFSTAASWFAQVPWVENTTYETETLDVRPFFEMDTSVISRELAQPGELTQGLCSPWQNDYRECSCYYWAAARPDFVNVEPSASGMSMGDNWLQKERTGSYVPDDYVDARLVLYDDLFEEWEKWLRFAIGGKDAPGEARGE